MQISKRLGAVANLVKPGQVLADIGTDHGYIPIYLIREKRVERALAMDVRMGPLQRAKEHIAAYQLQDKIETRLSDGLNSLHGTEADRIVIAGMGGALMTRILADGAEHIAKGTELVLQPQSELYSVRRWLCSNGYGILQEDMIEEDGKYYPMMLVRAGDAENQNLSELQLRFGLYLLADRNRVLLEFMKKEYQKNLSILAQLKKQEGDGAKSRIPEIELEITYLEKALG